VLWVLLISVKSPQLTAHTTDKRGRSFAADNGIFEKFPEAHVSLNERQLLYEVIFRRYINSIFVYYFIPHIISNADLLF
jgi:hypothetical protein